MAVPSPPTSAPTSLCSTRFSLVRPVSSASRLLTAASLSSCSLLLPTRRQSLRFAAGSRLRLSVLCARGSRGVVTKESWEKSILKSDKPVLVEFYASWCGPCRTVHRVIDEIAGEYAAELDCFVLNTDDDLSVAEDYEIKAVPVVLLFKKGKKRESIIGTMPKEFYIAAIERVLSS